MSVKLGHSHKWKNLIKIDAVELSVSHDECKDGCVLGCCGLQPVRYWFTFQRCLIEAVIPLKRRSICARLQGALSRKTAI